MNILIISHSLHPNPDIAAKRFSEMIPHLLQLGCRVDVITGNIREDAASRGFDKDVKIHEVGRPINIGLTKVTKSSPCEGLSSPAKSIRRLVRQIGFPTTVLDRTLWQWYLPAMRYIKRNPQAFQHVDVIVGSCRPFSSLMIARKLGKRLRKPWVADYRDLIIEHTPMKSHSKLLCFFIEKKITASCSGCITVSPTLTKITERKLKVPTQTIFNGIKDEWLNDSIDRNVVSNVTSKKYVYYAGRFYPHRMDAVKLCMAALKSTQITLKIRCLGPPTLIKELQAFARRNEIEGNIEILDPVDESVIEKEAEEALCNVIFEDLDTSNEVSKGTLTGKFLRLLAFKPPVLVVARKDSDINSILQDTHKGKVAVSVGEINSFLNDVCSDDCFEGRNEKIRAYSKIRQAKVFLEFLKDLMGETIQKDN